MSKKSVRNARPQKTKEQVEAEIKQRQEATRLRELVKTKLWPIVTKASKSVNDSQNFLQVVKISVQQLFNNQMWAQTLDDLKWSEQMNDKADRADYVREFLDQMRGEKVGTALRLTQGVSDEIERLLRKENSERAFSTLKTDFIENDPPILEKK